MELTIKHPSDASVSLLSGLIKDRGLAAVGFFWALVEFTTRKGGSISLEELDAFADSFDVDREWARDIVSNYGLFQSAELLFMDRVVLPGVEMQPQEQTKKVAHKLEFKTVQDLFNSTCRSYPRVLAPSERRKEKLKARLVEMTQLGDPLDVLKTVFEKMEASAMMKGQNLHGWKATFDWLIDNGSNWVKVYEGNYDKSFAKPATEKDVNSYWDK